MNIHHIGYLVKKGPDQPGNHGIRRIGAHQFDPVAVLLQKQDVHLADFVMRPFALCNISKRFKCPLSSLLRSREF